MQGQIDGPDAADDSNICKDGSGARTCRQGQGKSQTSVSISLSNLMKSAAALTVPLDKWLA